MYTVALISAAYVLLSVIASPLSAAALSVSPLTISVLPDGSPQVVRIQNQGRQEVLVHVAAVDWPEPAGGRGGGGDEILALPPVFKLKPNATQLVRLALRSPLEQPEERTYRLLVTEIPETILPINGVTFAVRLNLPVFVTPKGAAPDPVWTVREAPDGAAELVLRNEGRAHLRLRKLTLHEPDGAVPLLTLDQEIFALRGDEQSWRLERPAHALPQMLEVRAETPRGELVLPVTSLVR